MKTPIALIIAALVVTACATPSQMSADAEVKRLCAIDGGVKVYETVKLPAERFDKWGRIEIPSKNNAKPSDDYYYEWVTSYIEEGSPHSGGGKSVERSRFVYFRAKDHKLLGEQVSYSRIGGDVPGPWHPSSFTCPDPRTFTSADRQIFLKE